MILLLFFVLSNFSHSKMTLSLELKKTNYHPGVTKIHSVIRSFAMRLNFH